MLQLGLVDAAALVRRATAAAAGAAAVEDDVEEVVDQCEGMTRSRIGGEDGDSHSRQQRGVRHIAPGVTTDGG